MGISLNITNTMIFGCVWTLEVFHVVWSSVISWTCPMFSDFQSHFMGIYWNTLFVWSVIYLQYMVVSLNEGCPQIQNYTIVLSHLWWVGDPLFQEALKFSVRPAETSLLCEGLPGVSQICQVDPEIYVSNAAMSACAKVSQWAAGQHGTGVIGPTKFQGSFYFMLVKIITKFPPLYSHKKSQLYNSILWIPIYVG